MRRSTFARTMSGALLAAGVALTLAAPANAAPAAPTVAQLSAAQAKLDNAAASRPSSVTGWHVDQASKSLVVSVHGNDAGVAKWAKDLGAGAVTIEKVAEAPRPYWWNSIGGQGITSTTGGACSQGFNALSGNTRYVITAGHCTALGGTWSGTGGTIGTAAISSYPGNDYGLIAVTGPEVAFTALVDRYSAGSDVTLTGSSTATVGMAVCRSGAASGWHCGTVTATNVTVCYLDGCVGQLISTNLCAAPGDSGGSLVTNPSGSGSGREVHAVGLTSGGTGSCTNGGTSYFQPIAEALAAGSATLVTDS